MIKYIVVMAAVVIFPVQALAIIRAILRAIRTAADWLYTESGNLAPYAAKLEVKVREMFSLFLQWASVVVRIAGAIIRDCVISALLAAVQGAKAAGKKTVRIGKKMLLALSRGLHLIPGLISDHTGAIRQAWAFRSQVLSECR